MANPEPPRYTLVQFIQAVLEAKAVQESTHTPPPLWTLVREALERMFPEQGRNP